LARIAEIRYSEMPKLRRRTYWAALSLR
jgi:hypothetical protein